MKSIHRPVAAVLLPLAVVLATASTAGAHTGFESSDPADGAVLAGPVETITLVFTGEAEPSGSGFQVLDPAGELRDPTSADSRDGSTWILRFDPPLDGGVVGVRWTVKAPDAHPIDGSLSFTVESPPPAESGEANTARSSSSSEVVFPSPPHTEPGNLESFLDNGTSQRDTSGRIGAAGRVMTLAGTLVGVGALVFAAAVLRGDHGDVRHVLFWVRRAGVLVVIGASIELVAQIAVEGAGWFALLSPSTVGAVVASSFGAAVALRIVGGVALATGARFDVSRAIDVADPVVAIKALVPVGAGAPLASAVPPVAHAGARHRQAGEPFVHHDDHAWLPTVDSAGAALGAVALVTAHLFDGHTASAGNRLWTALADAVHVVSGAVWAGGVLMLAVVLWRRHRQGRELRALQLAVRFSVVATLALIAVGVAGLALTVIILDSPTELWATEWGRTLIAKTLFVSAAAAAGGYNHKVLVPRLQRAPEDRELAREFRVIITFEAMALVAVVIATALLMGAAS